MTASVVELTEGHRSPLERLRLRLWATGSPAPIYIGVVIALLGFLLVAVAWGQVAGETAVALQLPYLVSGGLTGLALVVTGLTIVDVAVRRQDAARRERQLEQLADLLREIKETIK